MQTMGETTGHENPRHERPTGERRRRREAERAAAFAQERDGGHRTLTRRELRYQQAEEAARLEAIATGELRLDLPSTHSPRTPEPPTPATPAPAAPMPSSWTPAPATSAPDASARAMPTRRSLRERLQDLPAPVDESPQERTATGRRAVVRTPSTAQGVRSLDTTGQLTGIQPVVRPDQPRSPWQPLTAAPLGTGSPAPGFDGPRSRDEQTGEADAPAAASVHPAAVPGQPAAVPDHPAGVPDHPATARAHPAGALDDPPASAHSATAGSAPEPAGVLELAAEEDDDLLPMRPQWLAIDSVGRAGDRAASAVPTRRSLRDHTLAGEPGPETEPESQSDDEDEDERPNPAVAVIKVLVLVLVAAVIGALIWLLADEAFGEDLTTAPQSPTIVLTDHPEETSAR